MATMADCFTSNTAAPPCRAVVAMSPPNDRSRPGKGGSEKTIAAVNTSLPNVADSAQHRNIPAYVVLLTTRYGMPRRRVYLDLGHARTAVQRAEAKGQEASLVLCKLEPVTADLGEVAE
jgi:hypothetical protein